MPLERSARSITCLLLCAAAACDNPVEPLPSGAVRFDVPAVYEWWWSLAEQCSGLKGDIRAVQWYVVPDAKSIPGPDGQTVDGLWYSRPSRVVVAGEAQFFGDVVRHEMLHALTSEAGHSRAVFIGKCSGVVVCVGRCLTDAGTPPPMDPAAIHASPSQLRVAVDVTPIPPSSTQYAGNFMMVVSAHNETGKALLIDLPPSGDAGPPVSFSYRIGTETSGQSYDMRADVPETSRFAVGEVKRFVFDLRNQAGPFRYDLAPGTYRFDGAYGLSWATTPPRVTVLP